MKLVALVLACAACVDPPKATADHGKLGSCGVVNVDPIIASPHVPIDSPITWPENPPTSGPHYPIWAAFDESYDDLARGFWLHDAEHGSIVLLYRCDAGCPDVASELAGIVAAMPVDPHCTAPVWARSVVVSDPLLPDDNTIAAVAWGTSYVATCFDADAIDEFASEHYGMGAEDFCDNGANFGGTPIA
ncbi:MAG TPA: DUF3105 domain-containing protein, partial [Kofleriaceae bacterium]|nr:DUF3105 domain-containing protein [Kofleriaceae bacterium]